MPNRILKESICTSDSVDALSWFEEVLFYRLIVNCDDFGRFDGRTAVIKNRLFPLKDNITVKAVDAALQKLASVELVVLYEFEGKPYLHLPSWGEHQTLRAKKSKYPAPECNMKSSEIICKQMQADVHVNQSNPNQNPKPNTNPKPNKAPAAASALDVVHGYGSLSPRMCVHVDKWLQYKQERREMYKPTGLQALISEIENNVKRHGEDAVIELINTCMAANWRGLIFEKLKNQQSTTQGASGGKSGNIFAEMMNERAETI